MVSFPTRQEDAVMEAEGDSCGIGASQATKSFLLRRFGGRRGGLGR